MKRVFMLVGKSGCGKTYISLYLQRRFGWKAVVSYTTRPMREDEANGREHWFVDASQVPSKDKMCAYTQFGGYEYWTEWEQFENDGSYTYVIDEKGLQGLLDKDKLPFEIIPIRINRANLDNIDKDRIKRDENRIKLPREVWKHTINNDGSLRELNISLDFFGTMYKSKIINNGSTNK